MTAECAYVILSGPACQTPQRDAPAVLFRLILIPSVVAAAAAAAAVRARVDAIPVDYDCRMIHMMNAQLLRDCAVMAARLDRCARRRRLGQRRE